MEPVHAPPSRPQVFHSLGRLFFRHKRFLPTASSLRGDLAPCLGRLAARGAESIQNRDSPHRGMIAQFCRRGTDLNHFETKNLH
jgi:hypothetical protein